MLKIEDGTGVCTVFFFNQPFRSKQFYLGKKVQVGGLIEWNATYSNATISNPDFAVDPYTQIPELYPIYRKIDGMSDKYLRESINLAIEVLTEHGIQDALTQEERTALNAPEINDAIFKAHKPQTLKDVEDAQKRVMIDKLYPFCIGLEIKNLASRKDSPFVIKKVPSVLKAASKLLPFTLTGDQNAAIRQLSDEMKQGRRVNALLQGDVGCGKTAVAVMLAALAAKNGYQSAIMAPTTVLAGQHFAEFKRILSPMGIKCVHLNGNMKAAEKRKALESIKDGAASVVIGTHAILSESVDFKALALIVVDEEHRFGVVQRELLKCKAQEGVHYISMSATPIPRSIATAVYGDSTELVFIKEKPAGRKDVKTIVYGDELKTYQSMLNQIHEGHQCYVVCPLIEDSDSKIMAGVESVDAVYQKMAKWFSRDPKVKIEKVSGDMRPSLIQEAITRFADGTTHILISTTIVEVGVNVPNATVMVIQNAERFGLAQLHQLRGRVGRCELQSYCVLLSEDLGNERLQVMVQTNDGFEIAEKDLDLRGAGELLGVKQSGANECISLMLANKELFATMRQLAQKRIAAREEKAA